MTRKLARTNPAARRAPWLALILGAALFASAPAARAAPLPLETDADISAFAEKLRDFSGASRIRWVVAGATRADALAVIARVESRLPASDRALAARLSAQSLAEAGAPAEGPAIRAWILPQVGASASPSTCSWQVWVTDPGFPSPEADAVTVPMAPNDRLPVSRAATFRVGHSGLLQNRLYAFDETRPGAIRDLATSREVNMPVAVGEESETIFLATARDSAPFLDNVKTALAASDGQRRELGPDFALRDKMLGRGRGIGANILSIPSDMISAKVAEPASVSKPRTGASPFMETCFYALLPSR